MTAPQFVNAAVVHFDTTANASPITTDAYVVSGTGHTLIAVIDHERANASSPLAITGVTRGAQSFTRVNKGDLGSAATVDVADMWVLENAASGSAPLEISHNGVTGSDIQIGVVEYDGGAPVAVSTPAYVPGSSAAVARFGITVPADARLVYLQVVTASAGTWTGPSHGTSRLTATVGSGTGGGAMAVADYAPADPPETLTDVGYAFTPASGSWSNGSNHVIGVILAAATETVIAPSAGAHAHGAGAALLDTGDLSPTVSRPPGGGDVDAAASIITDGDSAAPTIELFGDPESNDNIAGTKWEGFYADIDLKQTGRTPVFKLDYSTWRTTSTPPTNARLYWRLASDIGDLYAWQPFVNRSVTDSILTVSNDSAFAESAIQIANIPPVPYEELEDWLATWDANANIYRPQACIDLGVSSSAPNKYAYFDFPDQVSPDGIQVGHTFAFAFGITNPAATGPKKRLFHAWTHAGEWGGLRAMMRFAERLMSVSDADHDVLRDDFEHIFQIINTAGMVGGMARGSAEPGDVGEDPNRVWGSNAIDRSDINDPQNAVEASVAMLVTQWGVNGDDLINCTGQLAWHSHSGSQTKFGTYSTGFSAAEDAFLGHVEALYGSSLHNYGGSSSSSSTAFARSGTVGGFALTFEWSYAFADFLNEIGDSVDTIGPALVDTYQAGWLGAGLNPASALHSADATSAALLASAPALAVAGAAHGHHGGGGALSLSGQIAAASCGHGQHAGASPLTAAGVLQCAGAAMPHRAAQSFLSTDFVPPGLSGAVLRVRPDTRVLSVGAA
ncbi:hypothetical protein [Sphingosinicella soli]|uniref:Uncharacterized protein n=1 Tax=Sphingosinicella soli TaxID=333708 RepID=A0A7W7B488_9SPHN|nr:hypothetical protein [Sphingosinicella soli]MBB4633670.1 hypothetical protein [Sphingosinicella soli]